MGCIGSKVVRSDFNRKSSAWYTHDEKEEVIISFLTSSDLAEYLTVPELSDLSKRCQIKSFIDEHTVYLTGDAIVGDVLVVGKGTIGYFEIDHQAESTHALTFQRCVSKKGRGDIISFNVKNKVFMFDVITLEHCDCVFISAEEVSSFLSEYPHLKKMIDLVLYQNKSEYLLSVPLFRDIMPSKIDTASSMFRYKLLSPGEELFKRGSFGKSLYIVAVGRVKIIVDPLEGEEDVLPFENEAGEGYCFGEIAVMGDLPRAATIISTGEVILLELRKRNFFKLLKLVPEIGDRILQIARRHLAQNFRKFNIPFFQAIPESQYEYLGKLCHIVTYRKGDVIFAQGSEDSSFYMISHGTVSLTTRRKEQDIVLSEIGPGRYFGEVALVKKGPRASTATAMTKCVILSLSKNNFDEFFKKNPEALSDFKLKLARYNVSFDAIIRHPVGITFFEKHCVKEFSEEGIQFLLKVQDFENLDPTDKNLFSEFQSILDLFFHENSPKQVNISASVRNKIEKTDCSQINPTVFEQAKKEIQELLRTNVFPRFCISPLFQDFISNHDVCVDETEKAS